jgi:hypothetical protein
MPAGQAGLHQVPVAEEHRVGDGAEERRTGEGAQQRHRHVSAGVDRGRHQPDDPGDRGDEVEHG